MLKLVELASEILTHRNDLQESFADENREPALLDILQVGTSAGGARAKAVIAWNPSTNEVRSGQVSAGKGFESWLLKFNGVSGNRDDFALEDFKACAKSVSMKRGRAETILIDVRETVSRWLDYAEEVGVNPEHRDRIQRTLRLDDF